MWNGGEDCSREMKFEMRCEGWIKITKYRSLGGFEAQGQLQQKDEEGGSMASGLDGCKWEEMGKEGMAEQ